MSINRDFADLARSSQPGRNMLINGSMAIAQRGSLTGQGGADFYTTCDRWKLDDTAGAQARYTTSQGTSGGVSGKDPWLSINVTTAEAAVASGEKNGWNQFVEGNNTRQIINSSGQMKASAVSFDVKFKKGVGSSLSAPYTMCMTLICENNAYGWVEEISITADDTWEHKSFDITALAQAASDVDTSSGYRLQFMMFAGTTYNDGSAGWNSNGGGDPATSNQDNLADATGNILGITNVQWEVDGGTEFEHEDIGTALNRCYRYYERLTPNTATNQAIFQAYNAISTVASGIFNYTHKRAAPTLTFTAGATFEVRHEVATAVCTNASLSGSTDEDRCLCNFTVSSGLTSGEGCVIRRNDTDTTYIEVSAEL